MDFTLTQEQYEALIFLAREGAGDNMTTLTQLDAFLKDIEKANGVERDFIWVQWQELDQPLPNGTNFPETWPPELRKTIELITRKISRADVDAVLKQFASQPVTVLVTRDPAGKVGWTPVDAFFVT